MGKIIVSEFISLDGVIESPGPDGSAYEHAGWTMEYSSSETMKFKADELFASGALLLGATTYQGFAKAWPNMEGTGEFGEKMNSMPKYVVSNSLSDLSWNNSHLISGNELTNEVKHLKDQISEDILVNGSAQLSQALAGLGLIDSYRFLVYPIVLGSGQKLFAEGTKVRLQLQRSQSFEGGTVLLEYIPARPNS